MTTLVGYTDGKYNCYYPVTGLTSKVYNDYLNQHRKLEDPEFKQTDAKQHQVSHKSETSVSAQWKSDASTPVKPPKVVNTCESKENFAVKAQTCRSKSALIKDLTLVNILPVALLLLVIFYLK